jgi:SAM-dependent methyltransferase
MSLGEILKLPVKSLLRLLRQMLRDPYEQARLSNLEIRQRVQSEYISNQIEYLSNEVSELRSIVRYLVAESLAYQKYIAETRESFEYQWKNLSTGVDLLSDPSFQEKSISLLEKYTGFSKEWFNNKKVLDAGCGNGRWSWALCVCGAYVTAVDISPSGVEKVREVCRGFPGFTAKQHNLLEKLDMPGQFDLVFSYGVVHHTGNTWLAVQNVAECVRPGGYLFLMVYGEPRINHEEDYVELNQYSRLRHAFAAMTFAERVAYLREGKGKDHVHGWFDAVSPRINDLYRFDEINEWLHMLGFDNARLTIQNRNLHVITQRVR